MSEQQSEWGTLQREWESSERIALPDVGAMIARARRYRRRTLLIVVLEWCIAAAALWAVLSQWQRLSVEAVWLSYAILIVLVTVVVLGVSTWTRLRSLAKPPGDSMRDWLALRRHRAVLGLRLAKLTRWTVLALLPGPVLALLAAPGGSSIVATLFAVGIPVAVLAGGWLWARHQTARLRSEIREVAVLAEEWLGEQGREI